jgi:hypothetical protein
MPRVECLAQAVAEEVEGEDEDRPREHVAADLVKEILAQLRSVRILRQEVG